MRADLQIRVESYGIKEADAALGELANQGAHTARATDGFRQIMHAANEQAANTGGGFRRFGGVAGQLGYQLQDVAVQAQMGTSAFTILGQQGSQIASVFGPAGAMAGALIAVGAAVAAVAWKAFDTSDKLKALREDASQLSEAFSISEQGLLTYNERLGLIAQTAPEVAAALFEIKKQQLELDQELSKSSISKDLSGFSQIATEFGARSSMSFEAAKTSAFFLQTQIKDLAEEFGVSGDQVMGVARAVEAFQQKADTETARGLVASLRDLKGGSDEARASLSQVTATIAKFIETEQQLTTDDPTIKKTKNIQSMVEALQLEAETLRMTARERDLYVAKESGASPEDLQKIADAYVSIEAFKQESVLEQLQRRLMSEEQALDDNYTKTRAKIIETTQGDNDKRMELLGQLMTQYETAWMDMQSRLASSPETNDGRQATAMIESLQMQLMTEEELIDESYRNRYDKILTTTVAGSEQQNEALRLSLELYEQDFFAHEEKITAKALAESSKRQQAEYRIEKIILSQKQATASAALGLMNTLAIGNEKIAKVMLAVNTAMSISSAIQNTALAATGIAAGYSKYLPEAAPAMAAALASNESMGAIQVGLIAANGVLQIGKSGGGGGGGSASSIGGGGSSGAPTLAAPTQDRIERDPPVQIIFNGPVNGLNAEHIAKTLKEHIEDTDFVLVTTKSRNGRELRS